MLSSSACKYTSYNASYNVCNFYDRKACESKEMILYVNVIKYLNVIMKEVIQ